MFVMVVAESRLGVRGLGQPQFELGDDNSYILLRPRMDRKSTSPPKKNEKASSSASSSQSSRQRPASPNTGASVSGRSSSPPQESVPQSEPDVNWRGRAALILAQRSKPNSASSRRSPSPSMGRVSGHPLSAMAVVKGPATVETDIREPDRKEKLSVAKGDYHFVNIQGKGGIAAGAHTFQGGSITAAVTGDLSAGSIDTSLGGKGHLINQRGTGEYQHKVEPGTKFEKAVHSPDPSTTNVGTIAILEGPGSLNTGATQLPHEHKEKSAFKKYG